MTTANPKALPPRWRRILTRTLKVSAITTLMTLVLAMMLGLQIFQYYAVDPVVAPREMYHRTWQAVRVNYFDPSRLKNWDEWEHKFDAEIKTDEDAIKYARIMLESIGDPYTILHDAPDVQNLIHEATGKQSIIGLTFKPAFDRSGAALTNQKGLQMPAGEHSIPTVLNVVRGSSAHTAGINPGDALVAINGKSTEGLSLTELHQMLEGPVGEEITLVVRKNGTDTTVKVQRTEVITPIVSSSRLPGDIAYIRVEGFFQLDEADQLQAHLEQMQDCKGYIIDMRDNPGGFIHSAVQSAELFLDEGVISDKRIRNPMGLFSVKSEVTRNRLWVTTNGVAIPLVRRPNLTGDKPVVILVNHNTASAAELFTAALQDNGRVHVIGMKTYGKGIGQTLIPIGNGARLRVTNIYGFTPSGKWLGDAGITVRHGVEPDTEVRAPWNLLFGSPNDNQLLAAQEWMAKHLP